jgi:histidyl-tRNA synthetase
VLNDLDGFPKESIKGTELMIVNFGKKEELYAIQALQQFRAAGIRTELFPDSAKMKKQMTYANNQAIPYVILAGDQEIESGKLTFKNMETGNQESLTVEEIINKLR